MNTKILSLTVMTVLVFSCAKEKKYDEVYKAPEQESRSRFKTTRTVTDKNGVTREEPIKYMYVPMTLGSPREVKGARPFYQGDEKVVRLEWSSEGLNVLEIEKDERFTENSHNETPVLTIPGEYSEYRCKEDEFGDCTNAEEENTEVEWHDKDYFTPDYAGLKVKELNFLDVIGVSNPECLSITDTKLKDYEISDGVINIELEKTFKVNNSWRCYRLNYYQDKFSFNSFKVSYFYSMVELDKLASPDYEPIDYPIKDQDVFGFFKTKNSKLTDDMDHARTDDTYLVNRFNPNQPNGELVYYLSKEFNKPKNSLFKRATFDGVRIFNKGLAAADVPFKIVLKEQGPNDNISAGDLRYNQIVLIDDPLASGLLGYGPSVKNPYTGEILKAHTNMYGGVLTKIVRHTYEAAVDISEERSQKKGKSITGEIKVDPKIFEGLPQKLISDMLPAEMTHVDAEESSNAANVAEAKIEVAKDVSRDEAEAREYRRELERAIDIPHSRLEKMMEQNLLRKRDFIKEYGQLLDGDHEGLDVLEVEEFKREKEQGQIHLAHKHQPEFFPIANTVKIIHPELLEVDGIFKEDGKTLKRWDELTSNQKDEVRDIILYHSYIGTFIHELGHNMGLRHNFIASFDKDNYYTEEEAKAMGLASPPAYTSMMDYAYSDFNQLPVLGKYDVAALRFAYKREIELNTGEFVKTYRVEKDALGKSRKVSLSVYDMQKERQSAVESELERASELRQEARAEYIQKKQENPNLTADMFMANSSKIQEAKAIEDAAEKNQLKDYMFCTDENAGLSTRCNRHDEGSSLVEIVKHKIQRYEQYYRYRNLRNGRLDFNAYDIVGYYFARNNEFGFIRDVLEDYETFAGFFNPSLMEQGCNEATLDILKILGSKNCEMIEDRRKAVEIASDFLVGVIKTPDHQCALATTDKPNVVRKLAPLKSLYDMVKYDLDYVPMSCFDEGLKEALVSQGERDEVKSPYIVVGENGKFLNGFKDTDPNFKYVTDRAVQGVWVDKMVAFKQLFKRRWGNRSTDRNHMALVDIGFVQEKVYNLIGHLMMGVPLADPNAFQTNEGNTFQIPYVLGRGEMVDQVEDAFWWFKDRLGLTRNGNTRLTELLNKQVLKLGFNFNHEVREKAVDQLQLISVKAESGYIAENDRNPKYQYLDSDDYTYVAKPENALAYNMISTIHNTITMAQMEDNELIAAVFKRRTDPEVPEGLTPEQAAFFKTPANLHSVMLNNPNFSEAVFVKTFGPEIGPLAYKLYKQGPEAMLPIAQLKEEIMTKPKNPLNENERKLYEMPVGQLGDFVDGKLNEELLNYYAEQLELLVFL
ncbi:MAG: hypothetical protein CME62_10120 [Halobacteriovoraceae bacterium]|nr:hypothetical protein [Halobacteriovoraceae bacterium]|tara:strand:+ start:17792 stop:21757 length:3966 start_codon:yes stop_codon:yes gene_type:complete